MIGRPPATGPCRFGKAVPRRRDAIDLSFLAVTLPPRGRRSVGSWRKWCGDYRTFATNNKSAYDQLRDSWIPVQLLPRAGLSTSGSRSGQRPTDNISLGELFGEEPETRKLIRNDHSNLALWAELPKGTAHRYFDRVGLIQRSANFAYDQTLRFFNVRQIID